MQHVWIADDHDRPDVTLQVDAATSQDAAHNKAQRVAVKAHGSQVPPADEAIHTTTKHPWLTAARGWVPEGDLRLGERVMRQDGTTAAVVALAMRPVVADYYNLTVSQVHTYAVGGDRAVVHNTDGPCGETATGGPTGAERVTLNTRNGALAGGTHPTTGVPFDANGYPVFSQWRHPDVPDVTIEPSGTRAGDFARANAAAGLESTPEGYIWHHSQYRGVMQLIERGIHAATGHTGGFSIWG